uniref:Uncharacterized protein n=1 Tax=Manihot esculenta TaxID=3983 RepID=A0A199UAX9_MANES
MESEIHKGVNPNHMTTRFYELNRTAAKYVALQVKLLKEHKKAFQQCIE